MDDGRARAIVIVVLALIAGGAWVLLTSRPEQMGVPSFLPQPSQTAVTTGPTSGVTPATSATPTASPSPTASATETPTASATETPTAKPVGAVTNLRVESRSERAVALTWARAEGAQRYKVVVFGQLIGTNESNRAVALWGRSSSLQITIVPVGADGALGSGASIVVKRPEPLTPPQPTQDPLPTTLLPPQPTVEPSPSEGP